MTLRRLLMLPLVLGCVSLIVFLSLRVLPGDAAQVRLGTESSPERLRLLRAELGLDRPWHEQYVRWLGGLVRGDWGRSLRTDFRVSELVSQAIPATLELGMASLLLSVLIGVPAGIFAAARRGSSWDRVFNVFFSVGQSLPSFGVGTILILLVSLRLGWLPSGGYVSLAEDPWTNLAHLLLPALSLSAGAGSALGRMARSMVAATENAGYVRFAEAKGVPPARILWRHRLPNALGPVVALLGLECGYLLAGAVLVETLFGWPGIGKLLANSIFERDYPVVQALVMFNCAVFLVANAAAELLAALMDPRSRTA